MPTTLIPCALSLLLPATAGHSLGTELRYEPEAGTRVTRTYENPGERTLLSLKLLLGGEEHPMGDMEMSETFEEKVVVVDELVEVEEGRPTKLRRAFREMAHSSSEKVSMEDGDHEETDEQESVLEDATVVFTWDAEEESYAAAFEGKGPDDALLEHLEADVDLAGILPGKTVSEGDEWEVEIAAFRSGVLQPGGEMDFEGKEPRPKSEREAARELLAGLQGEVRARFAGTREVDGVEVGVIELKTELSGEVEVDSEGMRPEAKGTTVSIEQKLEGELLWDLERNLARSYEIEGKGKLSLKTRLAFQMGEEKIEGSQEMAFDVKETYRAVFEVGE